MPQIRKISDYSILDKSVWVGNCVNEVFDGNVDADEVKNASALWNHLDHDPYLHDKGTYRQRRYAEMIYDADTDILTNTHNAMFYQSKAYNTVNGGTRKFSLIDEELLNGSLLQRILKYFAGRFAKALSVSRLELYLHQVRILGSPNQIGLPTPEGIHKDGVDFSCQVLFGRDNVSGGESIIYNNNKTPLIGATMMDPLDFYCFRDPDIYHSVTPIFPINDQVIATRDILGIEFCVNRERVN